MPVVGKSFSSIGKDAFSPIVTGRRDELLKALLSFNVVGWHEAKELPFDSFELLWATERGLLTVRADVQWWSHGETSRNVKTLFEVTGPFLYRRFVTALLQHPSTPIEWQLESGQSDWIAPHVVQFKVNSKRWGLANALESEPEESKLPSLTGYLRLLEQRFDYNGRGGVFDGRSKKQSADEAFKQVAVMGFPPVQILRCSLNGALVFESPQLQIKERSKIIVQPNESGFFPKDLCYRIGCSSPTLNKYAKQAGVVPPDHGDRARAYTKADSVLICEQFLKNEAQRPSKHQVNAKKLLAQLRCEQ